MKKNNENELQLEQNRQDELELEQILKEIEEDPEIRDAKVPDHVGEKLFAQIKQFEGAVRDIPIEEATGISGEIFEKHSEEGAIEKSLEERYPNMVNMTEEEKRIFRAGLEATKEEENVDSKVVTIRRGKKKKKIYFMVAAIVVLSLATGTVGMGERYKWLQSGEKEMEGNIGVSVDSEEHYIQDVKDDETAAYEQVKKALGMPVVEIKAIEGLEFERISVWEDSGKVDMLYLLEDKVLCYSIILNKNKVTYMELVTDDLVEEKTVYNGDVEIKIQRYIADDQSEMNCVIFNYHNLYYRIDSLVEMEKLEEISKNLIFL